MQYERRKLNYILITPYLTFPSFPLALPQSFLHTVTTVISAKCNSNPVISAQNTSPRWLPIGPKTKIDNTPSPCWHSSGFPNTPHTLHTCCPTCLTLSSSHFPSLSLPYHTNTRTHTPSSHGHAPQHSLLLLPTPNQTGGAYYYRLS